MSSLISTYPGKLSEEFYNIATLTGLLRWRALRQPDKVAYTYLTDGESEEVSLTYAELDRRARAVAARLQQTGRRGDRVLLLYPPGLGYVAAFFGCLYAEMIAVPAYPPDPSKFSRSLPRLQTMLADSGAAVALTTEPILSRARLLFDESPMLESLDWMSFDETPVGAEDGWRENSGVSTDLAFLQYTSGSTGAPKGVMLTHENLLHNASLVYHGVEHSDGDKYVSWLPVFHDMGFMAGILQPLYAGIGVVSMSPVAFLQRPLLWLQAISRYRATTSGGPNFAYDLCARKVTPEQRAELDLSNWSVAFNGAEPIRAETLDRFVEAFGPCGFKREAFYPCYGLAEATLIVTGSGKTRQPVSKALHARALENNLAVEAADVAAGAEARTLVGCGRTLLDQKVLVVNPETRIRCESGEVGEVWVSGASVAQGYWGKPDETELTFRASLRHTGEGPFLRTGDLGFMSGGELYITGRLKDLIIVRGLNHYPQDVELTVERSNPALRPGCGAAFSVEVEGEEKLAVVQEIDVRRQPDVDAVLDGIREAVAREHELQVYAVALIKPGRIPKTTSGKIQRRATRAAFLAGKLDIIAEWSADKVAADAPEEQPDADGPRQEISEVAAWMCAQIAARLGVAPASIDVHQPIARYGLDSLAAIELVHGIETQHGVVLPMTSFLQSFSVAELSAQITERLASPADGARGRLTRPEQEAAEYPLSPGQQALWFLHQLAPESPAYNISAAVRVEAELDVPALRRAFEKIVERHPSLRATFNASQGGPAQAISDGTPFHFGEEDAEGWDEARLDERLLGEANRPFDLEHGPLLRVWLFRRSAGEHVLLLAVHHIVADFWSLALLMHELGELYAAERAGSQAVLPAPSLRYTDYARWQAETMAGPEGERLWAYWQKQLGGPLPVLNLPTDRPRPPVQTYRGRSFSFRLSAELTAGLKELSRRHEATLYMTLLASFQVLLHRYTGQEQFLVGSPTAGRRSAELADIVGYFVNPIVLRADLSQDPSFEQYLDRVRQTVLGAFEHQEYPFPLLVERLQPERDASRSPIFQVMFALQKTHLPTGESLSLFALGEAGTRHTLGELPLESVALEERVAQFDLTLMMAQAEDGLAGSLQYNTDLFDDQTVERMATHFQTLVEGIVADARARLSGLPLVPANESHKLLVEWNETRREYDAEACVQRLFEAQAEQTPDAPAVVCGAESLTYGELNARANQLARRLRAAGVGAEDTVGILTERSASMVVGLLGVLKAGGAYLPLDTAYPRERLSFMLRDARARVLLTQDSLAAEVEGEGLHVIRLDADWSEIAREDESNFDGGAASDNLAYVIYTSGSTGTPKGVEIAHGGLVNLVNWHQRAYGVTAGDRATQLAGTAFDASVWELWPYLTAGACIYMPDDETRASSWKLLRWLADNAVTICFLPTPLAEAVVEEALPPGLALRAVLTGGDVLHRAPRKALPFMLVNHYGPTENTVVTTRAAVAQGVEESLTPPPIGQPIDNTRVYLLDRHLRPVPVGVPGEMYVGGEGLARGYRHRPGLTAERFIPDPFAAEPGARLYCTGDLARYAPDGNIEFLGRLDHQVKVRGYRIELGEIEALLARHADVREAIVIAWEDVTGHTRLAAYVTPATEHANAAPLQSFLREKLPEYMVPSSFIFVEEMPLTANGKIDRAALPAPAAQGAEASEDAAQPRTPVEELLAGIWGQVLGRKRVGVNDNFFELGGHSLLATQAISRIRETLKVEIPLHRLFSAPTVAGLAAHVEDALRADQPLDAPPLVPVLRDGDLPLSFAQQRLWFLDQLEPGSAFYNIPAAVRLRGSLDQSVLEQSLNEIVRRHESLRTTFPEVNGQPVQLITAPQPLPLTTLDLRDLPADEKLERVNAAAVEEARGPFDLSAGPLTRVTLLRLDEDEYVLLLTLHHIIADGWSMGVLMRELTALYNAYSRGEASPLPELPIQYADFARWQREWLSGSALDTQLAYWRQQLSGAPALLELPSDRPRPAVQSHRGAQRTVTLGRELSADLAALSRNEGVTLFMLLLSGFQALLSRVTGQEDVSVGTPVAGRGRAEAEGLVGLFVNTLVLRADLSGRPSFSELLGRVRETCVGAYAHQDVPFEKLVEELAPERNLSHSPLFQVMFAWQDSALQTLGLTDVELCEIDGDTCTSKFDLTLYMSESKEGLVARAEYNTDLFDAETIGRLLSYFASLLAAATADPSRKVIDLPLLAPDERELILEGWNQTEQPYDRHACLHQLFERQAALTPDATALVGGPHRLTYDQLNVRANRLAHRLRALGVGPESRVGVMLSRTPSVLVSLLAVLKSGGAYVPLDPAYPRERLSFMLDDARVKVLLTETAFLDILPGHEAQVICLDADVDADDIALGAEGNENPESITLPENLAYVIYTSGSTGVPKGVAIAHRSAVAFLDWARGFFSEDELSAV
ncbi:MAG TPA: amino acid adenylation domain-containing protein, partial [Pyrinomonadaceae bacterium]